MLPSTFFLFLFNWAFNFFEAIVTSSGISISIELSYDDVHFLGDLLKGTLEVSFNDKEFLCDCIVDGSNEGCKNQKVL